MKVAELAAAAGVPVLYYITPQVWASRAGRLKKLARTVTKAAVILPFEEALLRDERHRRDVRRPSAARPVRVAARSRRSAPHTRHRSVGATARALSRQSSAGDRTSSRSVRRDRARAPAARSGAPGRRERGAARLDPDERCPFPLVHAASFTLLRAADAAMCKSGTTTLEAAVAVCPLVVAYRTGTLDVRDRAAHREDPVHRAREHRRRPRGRARVRAGRARAARHRRRARAAARSAESRARRDGRASSRAYARRSASPVRRTRVADDRSCRCASAA